MTLRVVAFVIAVTFGVSPAVETICEMNCDGPSAVQTTSGCHSDAESTIPSSLEPAGHVCAHQQSGFQAFVAGASARDVVASGIVVSTPAWHWLAAGRPGLQLPSMHGPPGSAAHTDVTAVLRI